MENKHAGRVLHPRAHDASVSTPAHAAQRRSAWPSSPMWEERGIRAGRRAGGRRRGRSATRSAGSSGAPAGSTVMHQNVAVAEAVALSCFVRRSRPHQVPSTSERQLPLRPLPLSGATDLDVVICESDEEIVERIDERTLLVPISHVLYKAGQIQDVEAIVRRAHEMGAHVILDCYQSAGIVPLDVTALDVDFAVGGRSSGSAEALGTAGCTCARSRRAARADLHRLAGARAPVRVRGGEVRDRRGVPDGTERRRPLCGTAGPSWRRSGSTDRESPPADAAFIDLADAAGFEVTSAREPDRRGGTVVPAFVSSRPSTPSSRRGRFSATFARTPASAWARTTSPPTTSSGSRCRSPRSSTRRGERHLGAVALH